MTTDDLAHTLNKLHQELAENPRLDEQTLASMRVILDDIQLAMARNKSGDQVSTDDSSPSTAVQKLQDAIAEFEARHPKLTTILTQIADRLSDMGI